MRIIPLCRATVCAFGLLFSLSGRSAETAPALTLRTTTAPSTLDLGLTDTTNTTWKLQTSSDLATWTDVATFKVRNSAYRFGVELATRGPRVFFRTVAVQANAVNNGRLDATVLPATLDNYANITLPAHLRTPVIRGQDNTPATNPITDAAATLGRVLFYDKRLSANNTVSCASCHQAEHGFSDPAAFSTGFLGGKTSRNSMGLSSARYYPRRSFFWDERAATLEDQVLMPIQNEIEMGQSLPALVAKLGVETYYHELFTAAFGDAQVTSERIARALAQFVRSIVSANTKYDEGVATGFANFTTEELQGRAIFNGAGNCNACHGTDNFVPGAINNNGLENPYVDKGVGEVTGLASDEGFFKVGSLRNIELTAPYMHDGRFKTLEEVVEFYNSGVVAHPNLSAPLRNPPGTPGVAPGSPRRLNLTAAQKAALVAFLKTLTDRSVTTDPRFADPFRYEQTLTVASP